MIAYKKTLVIYISLFISYISKPKFECLIFNRQVDRDCEFLEQERIMDYSLLVGLHFREASFKDSATPTSGARTPTGKILSNL